MLLNTPSMEQLAHVIAQTIVPAFLLSALAGFLSVLVTRLHRVVDRILLLTAVDNQPVLNPELAQQIADLKHRAGLINWAIFWAIISAITISVLVIVAFVAAFINVAHERGIAILFIVALSTLTVALVEFARETRIAIRDIDNLK